MTEQLTQVFNDEARCKANRMCERLAVREYFFEPNDATLGVWVQRNGLYREGIDRRVVFVCESPSQIDKTQVPDFLVGGIAGYRCWAGYNPRSAPFLAARKRYGFENCLITNTVKCGVPRPSTPAHLTMSECRACAPFLVREIETVQPTVVACVGGSARRIFDEYTLARLSFRPSIVTVTHYAFRGTAVEREARWKTEFGSIQRALVRAGLT